MKALIFHCKEYKTEIFELANRPARIKPEEAKYKKQECEDCVVAFITIEKGDKSENFSLQIADEIAKMSKDVGDKNIVIVPFAHLSNNLAESKDSLEALDRIEEMLKNNFNVIRAHFGSHKSLLLDVYGHPGNVRFREF
jgi:threonyl-tRNA synthetase